MAALFKKPVSLSILASFFKLFISFCMEMTLSILRSKTSGLKGFRIKSDTPTSKPLLSVPVLSSAVRKMTGVSPRPFSFSRTLNALKVSKPSISGIIISRRIRSGAPFSFTYVSNACPDFNAVTRILCLLRIVPAICRFATSSSTTIIHFAIPNSPHGFILIRMRLYKAGNMYPSLRSVLCASLSL